MAENYNFAPMTRKNRLFVAGSCLLLLAACQSPKDQIVRKWQIDSFESPFRDSMLKVQEHSIDTITVVDSNMAMYVGTFNVDSFKMLLKKQIRQSKEDYEKAAKESRLTFTKDGYMINEEGSAGRKDSMKYTLTDDKKLIVKPVNIPAGMPSKPDTINIEKISSSEMRFKVGKEKQVMYINLKPAGESKATEKKAEEKK
ncbi:hypothetical protein [Taibaiella koreensis]|uniref:hypothetical protein n=1 Tax=Taibaiella koreensis TaxID=1268548 RepID=UPI0013C373E5|nr:hypothetical protein [Taibaiella koreensis]